MNKPRVITGSTSVVLDSLRIAAALTVLVFHLFYHWFEKLNITHKLDQAAHMAVVVFFVLSGYVIAYTTTVNNRGGLKYMQARFSRLYSVVIPALIITAVCEIIIHMYSPALQAHFSRGTSWPRYIISGLFINEIWFFSAAPPVNGPLWSLSYEFWYYIIFGFWFYKKKGLKSFILPILAVLIAGPKILLMFPIWMMGYFAYHLKRPDIKNILSWALILASLVLAGLLVNFVAPFPHKLGDIPWIFSSQFLTDWIVGLCIGFALWILPYGNHQTKQSKWLRIMADLTFPLYVLHNPLIIVWDAVFKNKIVAISQLWLPFIGILFTSVIIGVFFEKQRVLWIKLFKYLSGFVFKGNTISPAVAEKFDNK
jgi:peptidoglycan/LPS O-acetylase OafA/YrhL